MGLLELEGRRLSDRGPNPLNGHAHRQSQAENDDDDDDGGFLSDEVDERRSYTPQPRGMAGNVGDAKDEKCVPTAIDISSITLENEIANNNTIMNLSKISKANEPVVLANTSLKSMQKNPSTILPSSGQNLLGGFNGQQ